MINFPVGLLTWKFSLPSETSLITDACMGLGVFFD
jgi:hypothetical protein